VCQHARTHTQKHYKAMTTHSCVVLRSVGKGPGGGRGFGIKISLRTVIPGDMKCLLSAIRCNKKNAQKLRHDTEKLLWPNLSYTSAGSNSVPYRVNVDGTCVGHISTHVCFIMS